MAGQSVSAHLDPELLTQLRAAARGESRPVSQITSTALKLFLDMTPGARQSIYSLQNAATDDEQAFLARFLGRQVLRAHHMIVESRYLASSGGTTNPHGANAEPQSEDDIEQEAARVCRLK